MTSLSQEYLDKKDKKSNIYLGDYSELRVYIFKYLYKELSGLVKEHNDNITEKKVSHITEDLLEFVDKDRRNKEKK